MRANTFLCAAIGVGFAVGAGALAGGPDVNAAAERVAELIGRLGDEDFEQREAASTALATIGEPALAALQKAMTASEDAEVRSRAGDLVETIENSLPYLFNGKD